MSAIVFLLEATILIALGTLIVWLGSKALSVLCGIFMLVVLRMSTHKRSTK
jgi:hypothetical protein